MASMLKAGTDMFDAIFTSAAVAARTTGNAISLVSTPIDMAHVYLSAAAERQQIDTIALMENYEEEAVIKASEDHLAFVEGVLKRITPARKPQFDAIHTKIAAKVKARHTSAE